MSKDQERRIRGVIRAERVRRAREALPAIGVVFGFLLAVGAAAWFAVSNQAHYRDPRPDLYCTDHDGGEICTKGTPSGRSPATRR